MRRRSVRVCMSREIAACAEVRRMLSPELLALQERGAASAVTSRATGLSAL